MFCPGIRRIVRVVAAVALVAPIGLIGSAGASAAVVQEHGDVVTPAQPYLHNPQTSDWIGSYLVGGTQAWGADFGYGEPDSAEAYSPGGTLTSKWGTPVDAAVAAELSYLLWRYGTTSSDDDAAALAHLTDSWLSAPQTPSQLDPANDSVHIAYDVNYHLSRLPASAQAAVTALQADAVANHGPWTANATAPSAAQADGTPGTWMAQVLNPASAAVASVPITVTATQATLPNGTATQTFTTPADGSPLSIAVIPTGTAPALTVHVMTPAAAPSVLLPARPIDQTLLAPATLVRTASAGTTAVAALAVSTTALPAGQVGVAYTAGLEATGGTSSNHQWSVISGALPLGLTLSTSGTISGTPTAAGTANFTVQVDDPATAALAIVIAPAATSTVPTGPAGPTVTLSATATRSITPAPAAGHGSATTTVAAASATVSSTASSTASPAPEPDPPSTENLAATGSNLREPAGVGLALFGAGLTLVGLTLALRRPGRHH